MSHSSSYWTDIVNRFNNFQIGRLVRIQSQVRILKRSSDFYQRWCEGDRLLKRGLNRYQVEFKCFCWYIIWASVTGLFTKSGGFQLPPPWFLWREAILLRVTTIQGFSGDDDVTGSPYWWISKNCTPIISQDFCVTLVTNKILHLAAVLQQLGRAGSVSGPTSQAAIGRISAIYYFHLKRCDSTKQNNIKVEF